jgi:hypothetical protein
VLVHKAIFLPRRTQRKTKQDWIGRAGTARHFAQYTRYIRRAVPALPINKKLFFALFASFAANSFSVFPTSAQGRKCSLQV